MKESFRPLAPGKVKLLPSLFQQRFDLNRRYLLSLSSDNLLQNHYLEAGLWGPRTKPHDIHWGWESPTCQLRGHFLGHWLSAAARIYANTGDAELKGKADRIVSELARCQEENGGEWAGSVPAKYLDWVASGKRVWAPHYTLHKTLMGLVDMVVLAGSQEALDILVKWARWFYYWTGRFSREQMDDILDVETGGMLEAWANLYAITGQKEHLELVRRYNRRRLFDPLLAGEDVLTNQHANTTIPEAHGAARAWEITGEPRWREIAEAYWRCAVIERGYYATGGQTNGEIWSPPGELSARLGDLTQEHCTVYNMMRLTEYLLRWTGDVSYLDYWERNLYNGILAQQNPETGMVAYFLPMRAGSVKNWGTPTDDFWCCHGTLVQAHTMYANNIYYEDDAGLVLGQFIPNELTWERDGETVNTTLTIDQQLGQAHRPRGVAFDLAITSSHPQEFTLKIRVPWWVSGEVVIRVNGERQTAATAPSTYVCLHRTWHDDLVHVELPKRLTTCPLPDDADMVAFMDGPVVLVGLCDEARTLHGDKARPETMLTPDNEREWANWRGGYRTKNEPRGFRFVPLYAVKDERYTTYFPIQEREPCDSA
jgi:DUF1680 family protein